MCWRRIIAALVEVSQERNQSILSENPEVPANIYEQVLLIIGAMGGSEGCNIGDLRKVVEEYNGELDPIAYILLSGLRLRGEKVEGRRA